MLRHPRLTPAAVLHRAAVTLRRFAPALLVACGLGLSGAPAAGADPPGWFELPNSPVPSPNVQRHDDIDFIDKDHGWLVNGDGDVWSTKDAGATWDYLNNTLVYNRCVGFADSLHGWIGTLFQSNGDALQATSDGGHTWSVVALPAPKPRGICGMWVVGDSVVNGVGAYYGTPRFVRSVDISPTYQDPHGLTV